MELCISIGIGIYTRFELLLSKDVIKDLIQALKLDHPAEHMHEGSHYLIT